MLIKDGDWIQCLQTGHTHRVRQVVPARVCSGYVLKLTEGMAKWAHLCPPFVGPLREAGIP